MTALQALAMLNDRFIVRQAEHFAARLRGGGDGRRRRRSRGRTSWRSAGRRRTAEVDRLADYAAKHGLANACRVLLNSNEFLFVD